MAAFERVSPLARSSARTLLRFYINYSDALHHVVADGWSLGVLGAEISALYNAFVAGKPSPLPDLPIQYRDFVAWQRDWLSGPRLERQLAYWRAKLTGSDTLLDLPTDRPRPLAQSHRGAMRHLLLPGPLTAGIEQLSGRIGCALGMGGRPPTGMTRPVRQAATCERPDSPHPWPGCRSQWRDRTGLSPVSLTPPQMVPTT